MVKISANNFAAGITSRTVEEENKYQNTLHEASFLLLVARYSLAFG